MFTLTRENLITDTQPFISNEEFSQMLDTLIIPQYKPNISDWIYYAKPNEKKGLYILSKVIKHKGESMFKTQLTKTKEEENDVNKLTLEEAFKRYQKKKVISSYSEFYGANLDDKYKYNNILKFKDFEHLNYAEFIAKEYHGYIQNWVKIEKTEQYKEYVLDFLRSFLATIRSNRKFVTHYAENYKKSKDSDKFSSHATYIQSKKIFSERVPTLEEMRARLNLDKQQKEIKDENNVIYNDNAANLEEIKKRKMELINGKKNLLKGIYKDNTSSCYQDTYKGLPNKYPYAIKSDFSTSMIKGIMPDPYTLQAVKSSMCIGDDLKNSIKSIM